MKITCCRCDEDAQRRPPLRKNTSVLSLSVFKYTSSALRRIKPHQACLKDNFTASLLQKLPSLSAQVFQQQNLPKATVTIRNLEDPHTLYLGMDRLGLQNLKAPIPNSFHKSCKRPQIQKDPTLKDPRQGDSDIHIDADIDTDMDIDTDEGGSRTRGL